MFQKSNTYRTLHGIYEELGAFGTAGSIVLSDPKTAIHHYPVTIGEYAIATDYSCSWPIAIKDLILTFTIYDEN